MQNKILKPEDCVWLSPLNDEEVQIVDKNSNITPVGSEGIVRVKLHLCDPNSYLNDSVATAQFFSNGYFYTGDLATRREDGKIKILGRDKNVINIGGDKKPIEEIELSAMQYLEVNELYLFTMQNENGEVVLKVVINDSKVPNKDNLNRFMLAIGSYFSSIEFHGVKNFPCQTIGMPKVDRTALLKSLSKLTLLKNFKIVIGNDQ
jgi:non-ribosomal peptide synthetase component E (peptide arylation enzyme)